MFTARGRKKPWGVDKGFGDITLPSAPRLMISTPAILTTGRAPSVLPAAMHGRRIELAIKRAIDLIGSIFLITILSPIFLAIAMAIKVTSRGPIFFRSQRIGFRRQPFSMWKFRTMKIDAVREEVKLGQNVEGLFFKLKQDWRITPLGAFLRRYSLDELPNLFSVVRGEMSLVGPRPILPVELSHFDAWKQLRRFSMKPGLTCIWQVSGRNNTTDQQRLEYDLQYVREWSLLFDLRLLLKTIPAVLKGEGAY